MDFFHGAVHGANGARAMEFCQRENQSMAHQIHGAFMAQKIAPLTPQRTVGRGLRPPLPAFGRGR